MQNESEKISIYLKMYLVYQNAYRDFYLWLILLNYYRY